jgi:uncharacterized protein YndB with AHSA1/START domain
MDLRAGGAISFTFPDEALPPTDGRITELDPPRRFAFSWGDDHLRFELESEQDGAGCLLRFTHVLDRRDRAARDAAGWHVCLDMLARRLGGDATRAPTAQPTGEWRARYAEYVGRGLPAGAPVPTAR